MTRDIDGTGDPEQGVLDLDEKAAGGPARAPAAGGGAPDLATLMRVGEQWGYVDDDGGIHVRAGRFSGDRVVARVAPSQRAEVLARLLLRFQELEDRFQSLCREVRRSKDAGRTLKSLTSFLHWVEGAEAIGDYDSLLGRIRAEIARVEERVAAGRSAKLALVERAEALVDSTRWKTAGEAMNELMEEWRCVGSAGREQDEALWARFRAARQAFFARRKEHFAALKRSRAEARDAKEALIVRAEALASSTDYEGTFAEMGALLEEWKEAGSAGRDVDDELWERFHAAREPFFERRRGHLAERRRGERRRTAGGERPGRSPGGDPRRGRGLGPGGSAPPRRRGGDPGVLRSSLAELVGPLKDLFPAERSTEDGEAEKARKRRS